MLPTIKSSAELRNNYSDISNECHTYPDPIYITKNGKGDLAVMSIEALEQLQGRIALYEMIADGMRDVEEGNTRPFAESMAELKARRHR